jgi:hypothetical protein
MHGLHFLEEALKPKREDLYILLNINSLYLFFLSCIYFLLKRGNLCIVICIF